jgi:hypothetical protein
MRPPPETAVAPFARDCPLLSRARAVAAFVGDSHAISPKRHPNSKWLGGAGALLRAESADPAFGSAEATIR